MNKKQKEFIVVAGAIIGVMAKNASLTPAEFVECLEEMTDCAKETLTKYKTPDEEQTLSE